MTVTLQNLLLNDVIKLSRAIVSLPFRNRKSELLHKIVTIRFLDSTIQAPYHFPFFFLKMTYLCSCSWQVRKYRFVEKKWKIKGIFLLAWRQKKIAALLTWPAEYDA
jgi:hypothetical protein